MRSNSYERTIRVNLSLPMFFFFALLGFLQPLFADQSTNATVDASTGGGNVHIPTVAAVSDATSDPASTPAPRLVTSDRDTLIRSSGTPTSQTLSQNSYTAAEDQNRNQPVANRVVSTTESTFSERARGYREIIQKKGKELNRSEAALDRIKTKQEVIRAVTNLNAITKALNEALEKLLEIANDADKGADEREKERIKESVLIVYDMYSSKRVERGSREGRLRLEKLKIEETHKRIKEELNKKYEALTISSVDAPPLNFIELDKFDISKFPAWVRE